GAEPGRVEPQPRSGAGTARAEGRARACGSGGRLPTAPAGRRRQLAGGAPVPAPRHAPPRLLAEPSRLPTRRADPGPGRAARGSPAAGVVGAAPRAHARVSDGHRPCRDPAGSAPSARAGTAPRRRVRPPSVPSRGSFACCSAPIPSCAAGGAACSQVLNFSARSSLPGALPWKPHLRITVETGNPRRGTHGPCEGSPLVLLRKQVGEESVLLRTFLSVFQLLLSFLWKETVL
ncbi:PREDICTED: translation initiation factor IF-2-like, partial [Chinchilla lanigera]|uniref:translation initiation factor IF-2-like n=1 Tax=Chinchilla lanigera TaxID=34839 RepID=UPI0006977BEE